MKKFILAAIPAALLFSGCENPCDTGLALKNRTQTLEAIVSGTITTPGALPNTCGLFRAQWSKELLSGSRFASTVANRHFYWEERNCARGHYERDCWYDDTMDPTLPGRGRPYYRCQQIWVCDAVQVVPHKRDGYNQAIELANMLTGAQSNLATACLASERGDTVEAVAQFAEAKLKLRTAEQDAEYVLRRAGCYERKGN